MHGGNAGGLEPVFERKVEIRRVDADEDARPLLQKKGADARTDAQQFGQVAQHLDVAVDRQFFARVDRLDAGLDQARAGNAGGVNNELPADWTANRSRTLCPWPSVSRYKGSGSLDAADSFVCSR